MGNWVKGPSGNTSECFYNVNDDKVILKLFKDTFPKELALEEYNKFNIAYNIPNINVPKALELVDVDDKKGIIFERLFGHTISKDINLDKENKEIHYNEFFNVFKNISNIKEGIDALPSMTQQVEEAIHYYFNNTKYEKRLIDGAKYLDSVYKEDVLLHGDLHPNNIIHCGDKYYLIDIGYMSKGSVLYNLGVLYTYSSFLAYLLFGKLGGLSYKQYNEFFTDFIIKWVGKEKYKEYINYAKIAAPLYTLFSIYKENCKGIKAFFIKIAVKIYANSKVYNLK